MNSYLKFIESALGEAAKVARRNFGRVSGTTKADDNNQILTETDLEIGQLILKSVLEQFPDHNVIDEEAGVVEKYSEFTWVIDPIDGTSNFAANVPTYGIMIGLLDGGKPIAGGIALPSLNEIYLGGTSSPATLNGTPIKVSAETNLLSSLVAYGIDGHQESPILTFEETKKLGNVVLGIRNIRSSNSCFDTAMVARGGYGVSLNQTSKIWDNVAQQAIIEAAGGLYTDFYGHHLTFTNPTTLADQKFTWCFGAPTLHQQIQDIVHH
jgi:myo-inositol-1(or 4)-monophosphatase